LLYKISNDYLISAIILSLDFLTVNEVTGIASIWPHSLGSLLFFSAILLFLKTLETNRYTPAVALLIIVLELSVVFMSYNQSARFIIYLLIMLGFFFVCSKMNFFKNDFNTFLTLGLFRLFVLMILMQFGISKFIYDIFLPMVTSNTEFVNPLEKFSASYFGYSIDPSPLSQFLIAYPRIITEMNLIRYGLYLISILLFLYVFYKQLTKQQEIPTREATLFFILVMGASLSLIRTIQLGALCVSSIYISGILSLNYLWGVYPRLITLFLICLFISTSVVGYEANEHELNNKNINNYEYIVSVTDWVDVHIMGLIKSDELSKNFLMLDSTLSTNNLSRFDEGDLLLSYGITSNVNKNNYFIINYNLNNIAVGSWTYLKSWRLTKHLVENNSHLSKIFDKHHLSIYQSS